MITLVDVLEEDPVEETVEWRHRRAGMLDPETGQGIAHVQYTFSAHRAVVVVDTKPGRVKVVALDTAQDVGRALHLQAVIGQTQDEPAHGMELALMEDVIVTDARAIRQATGMALSRLPIRPEHLRGC